LISRWTATSKAIEAADVVAVIRNHTIVGRHEVQSGDTTSLLSAISAVEGAQIEATERFAAPTVAVTRDGTLLREWASRNDRPETIRRSWGFHGYLCQRGCSDLLSGCISRTNTPKPLCEYRGDTTGGQGSTGIARLSSDTGWKPMLHCFPGVGNDVSKATCREVHGPTATTRQPNVA
jgi:hypothetical protein